MGHGRGTSRAWHPRCEGARLAGVALHPGHGRRPQNPGRHRSAHRRYGEGLDFVKSVAMAKRGHRLDSHKSPDQKAEQEYQKSELERSLKYCKETLGLDLKA